MHLKPVLAGILLSVLFLSNGCTHQTPRKLSSDIQIPENGLISEDVLKEIKENNLVTVFRGISNGHSYEWTIFGNDLENTNEINLYADITIEENAKTEIVLNGNSSSFSSVISIHTDSDLRGIHFDAYEITNDSQQKCGTVTVTGEGKSILNFSPGKLSGKYILKPETEIHKNNVSESITEKSEKKSAENTENKAAETADISSISPDISKTETISNENNNNDIIQVIPEQSAAIEQKNDTAVSEQKDSELKCTVLVECTSVFSNLSKLEPGIIDTIPSDGVIVEQTETTFSEGESVFDVIKRLCTENRIHFEFEYVPLYNSSYVTAFNNLYEFDCGSLSGWLYSVNGWFPNYGSSCYELKNNDVIEWRYTCDLGKDVNGGNVVNQNQ